MTMMLMPSLAFSSSAPISLSTPRHLPSITSISTHNPLRPRFRDHRRPPPSIIMSSETQNEEEVQKLTTEEQQPEIQQFTGPFAGLKRMIADNKLKASKLRNYGVAAFISYGLFDLITYCISFLLALRAYVATGKVLTWETLPQVLALMWGINNFSRPFRIAGAIALAPVIDKSVVKPVGAFFSGLRQPPTIENSNSTTDTTTDTTI